MAKRRCKMCGHRMVWSTLHDEWVTEAGGQKTCYVFNSTGRAVEFPKHDTERK